jgi:pimeloyl-ACP methyl ester carboxylesterase
MGGVIAMHLAIAHPQRVSRLVLVDSASEAEARRGLRFGRLFRHLMVLFMPLMFAPGRERAAYRAAVHDPALLTPEVLDGYIRPLRMRGHLRALSQQIRDRGKEPRLDPLKIQQPTLLLWGEHDRVVPLTAGEALSKSISGARLDVIRSAGHLPLEEQPESSSASILRFLRGEELADAPHQAEVEARS